MNPTTRPSPRMRTMPRREHELEPQDDALRPRLRAEERDARARQRLELLLEELVLRRVRACDADGDGRRRDRERRPRPEDTPARPRLASAHARRVTRLLGSGGAMTQGEHESSIVGVGSARARARGGARRAAGTRSSSRRATPAPRSSAATPPSARTTCRGLVELAVDRAGRPRRRRARAAADARAWSTRSRRAGIRAFGPTRAAARLEGSKAFMKRFCERHGIPTAPFAVFDDPDAAERHVRRAGAPARGEGRRPGGGQGRRGRRAPRRRPASPSTASMRKREFGDAGAHRGARGAPPRRRGELPRRLRRRRAASRSPPAQDHKRVRRRRPRAQHRAAWARTRRRRS